jgi:hypothetical protein
MHPGALSVTDTRALRAPVADGGIVAIPPLADAGNLIEENRQRVDVSTASVLGSPLADLRRSARREIIAAAQAYFEDANEPAPTIAGDSILLAGHQPELFHPGVWIKNFALNGLATKHTSTPINLIVDNDVAKSTAIHVPSLSVPASRPLVAYEAPSSEIPYEELRVRDEALFASFPERVMRVANEWGYEPLVRAYWQEVQRQSSRTPLLGERLAAARRAVERQWGCHNLELPVSRLCATPSFTRFAWHLLTDLPRFHAIHNAAVHEYRRTHGLRSRSHPVPDLITDGDWLEAPFWAWHPDHPRRRLMSRTTSASIDLRLGNETVTSIPLSTQHSALKTSLKIRPRALTNTLFARLFVCDAFMHGIGGAKYDEVTDTIIERFYGIRAPRFLALSGTLLLPLPRTNVRRDDCEVLARTLRDLHWNPQRHLSDVADPSIHELVGAKESQIRSMSVDGRERWRRLRDLTDTIRPAVAELFEQTRRAVHECRKRTESDAILSRRDYAFCLFPEGKVRTFCTQFLDC